MFSRCEQEYIIAYKLMIHRQTLVGLDIDLFAHISVKRIKNMVKDFKTHRFMLDLYSLFLSLLLKWVKEIKITYPSSITDRAFNIR